MKLLFIFTLFFVHCSFPIQEKYSKLIAEEKFFIKNSSPINNLALSQIKNHNLDEAEKNLKKATQKGSITSFLNLFRLYFILDEYESARKLTKSYLKNDFYSKTKINKILNRFQIHNRTEEEIIFLDVLFKNKEFQFSAAKKLGKYFLSIKKYREAFFYYDKVLLINPFDREARIAMMTMAYDLEKWQNLLKFIDSFEKTGEKTPNLYYYAIKAHYELGNYYKSLRYIDLIKYNKDKDFFLLNLWEKSILSIIPTDDLQQLAPYKQQIKNNHFLYNIPYKVRKDIIETLLLGV